MNFPLKDISIGVALALSFVILLGLAGRFLLV